MALKFVFMSSVIPNFFLLMFERYLTRMCPRQIWWDSPKASQASSDLFISLRDVRYRATKCKASRKNENQNYSPLQPSRESLISSRHQSTRTTARSSHINLQNHTQTSTNNLKDEGWMSGLENSSSFKKCVNKSNNKQKKIILSRKPIFTKAKAK